MSTNPSPRPARTWIRDPKDCGYITTDETRMVMRSGHEWFAYVLDEDGRVTRCIASEKTMRAARYAAEQYGATGQLIERGPMKGRTVMPLSIGDPCDICEGPCRFGNCLSCGGHSEHNAGCPEIPGYRP